MTVGVLITEHKILQRLPADLNRLGKDLGWSAKSRRSSISSGSCDGDDASQIYSSS